MSERRETATLGGGCFWCLEAAFEGLRGVERVVSGYAGGHKPDPAYREVCDDTTGHAEVVQITYDPEIVSYRDLLEVFFTLHDPTTPNRQGADVGSQYRSIILYHDAEQKAVATQTIAGFQRDRTWPDPIVTQVEPLTRFYRAEDYHQGYFRNNPNQPYCRAVVAPKVAKLRQHHLSRLRA
jgi:peptide-methionine (S)-S-oxide reductase